MIILPDDVFDSDTKTEMDPDDDDHQSYQDILRGHTLCISRWDDATFKCLVDQAE